MKRGRKIALWSGGALLLIICAVLATLSWVLFTTSGARWVAELATSRFAPMVKYASLDGTIAGELRVTDFRFEGDPTVAKVRIARMTVDPTLRMLFSRVLRIERATVEGLVLTLPEQEKPDEPDEPLWVEPPLEVVVKDFALRDGRIIKANEKLFSVRQLGIAARWSRDAIDIERLELLPGDIEGDLSVKGRITPAGQTLRGVLDAKWKDVVIPERLAGRVLASAGALRLEGTPEKYLAKGELDVGPPGDPTHVMLDVAGTDSRAVLHTLELRQRAGRFAVNGTVEFQPVAWNLAADARDFNPGTLLAEWPGRINLALTTRGVLAEAGPRGNVSIGRLDGTLRGRPIAGGGDLAFAAPDTLSGELNLRSGRSRVAVRGNSHGQEGIDAHVELAVASLNDWVPETGGSLAGNFRVRGTWPKLTIAGTANGKSLAVADAKVASLRVEATVATPLDPSGNVRAEAKQVSAAGLEFARVSLSAEGNQAKHRFALDADGERLDVTLALSGEFNPGGRDAGAWRAELSKLTLRAPDVPALALRAPARIVVDESAFEITEACLADEAGAALCAAARVQPDGALSASYSFEKVPLGLANAFAPEAMPGQLRGELAGRGAVKRGADGQWLGDARIESAEARLVMRDDEPGISALGQRTWLLYQDLDVTARLRGNEATADVTAALQDGGTLDAKLQAHNLMAEAPGLGGTINASLPTLAPFTGFVPGIANLDGAVSAQIRLGGTFTAPEVTGTVDATRLQADLGEIGIELRDGRVQAAAKRGGGFVLAASVASGKGHLELAGTMSARGDIDATILGQNFQAADIPAANVIFTPNLKLTGDPKAYLLTGEVTIPRAEVNLQKLPQDEPPGVSPDVVVLRDGKEVVRAEAAAGFPISAAITVKLGDKIAIQGYGLDATVSGQLDVRESPGMPTTGSGMLSVAGRYKAYGQDLTIKDGRLLFAGTPLDNPRLAIVAMREINDKLSTGLRIAGSAQRPIITVISDPNVGEADALSYLVTGRSLNEVGTASGGSQDALASATRSLEGAGAGLVAKRIGQRLGLDEAGVEENEMIGGSALTIGEYLSPRLYLSYGVGLFEPGEVIALRYKLSDDIGVKVQRGSEETRAGVEYRIER
jgi:translocation and assembly module TamB